MIHKGVKFAYAVIMSVSAAMAFIVLRNFDEAAIAGPSYVVAVFSSDRATEGARVPDMVTSFARARGVNVGRLYWDPRNESYERVYLAVGDQRAESTRWLETGYPNFSREAKTELRPYREIGNIDPTGYYFVYSSSKRTATDLLDKFNALGFRGRVDPLFSLSRGLEYFGHGALLWCFLVVGLVAILAVASAVVLNARSYGVQRLQGQSFTRIFARDLRQVGAFCSIAAPGSGVVTLALLYWYNGWNQLGTYALVALSFLSFYVFAALATHVAALALVHRGAILGAVKGEVTAGWTVVGAYALRAAAIVVTLAIGTSAIGSGLALQEHGSRNQAWSRIGDAYYMQIGSSVGGKNGEAISDKIGQWIRDADIRGEMVLAHYLEPGRFMDASGSGRDIVVVNNRYLAKHAIHDAAGARVRPDDSNTVRVLVPQRYSGQSNRIAAEINREVKSLTQNQRGPLPPIRLEQIRSGQSVFSYSSSFQDHDLLLKDPIIVVMTGGSRVIPNETYTAWATQQAVIFDDPDRAMKSLADSGLGPNVLGMSSKAQEAAVKYRDAKREFALQMFNLVAAVAVLLITAIGVSIVYCRRNAQTLFVKYISGWGFLRTHRWILAVEGTLALALVLWTWHRTMTIVNASRGPQGSPLAMYDLVLGGWEPAVAAGVALLGLALITVALARTNARFVKAHSASLA